MGKKKNRCAVSSCRLVIDDRYVFCYMHRHCKLKSIAQALPLRSFFCDDCGNSTQSRHKDKCHWCGGDLIEVGVDS